MDKSPLFIGGIGGSGTRALVLILEHFRLAVSQPLNNSLDYQWFAFLFKQARFFTLDPKPELEKNAQLLKHIVSGNRITNTELELVNSSRQKAVHPFLKSYFEATRPEAVQLIKEPNTIYFIPELAKHFSDSRFILLMRNPLEMVLSENQQQLRNWGTVFGISDENDEESKLRFWLAVHKHVLNHLVSYFPSRNLVLRYNDLGTRPDAVMQKLEGFLKAPLSPSALKQAKAAVHYKAKTVGQLEKRLPKALVDEAISLFELYKLG
jgi:hypothetical protein